VAPFAYPIAWLKGIDGRHLIFQFGSQVMSLIPGMPGVYLRREYYKVVLGLRSTGFVIEFGCLLCQRGIEIGNNVYVGAFCNIGLSTIEDDVLLGSNVDIVSGGQVHHFDRTDIPIRLQGGELRKIRIGRDTWIGNKAVVMEDVAEGSVVGAGSVVTKKFEPGYVLAGSPARPIRRRVNSTKTEAT
jgi:acetyltransferase-like isoleucine patch superfamily enzyme